MKHQNLFIVYFLFFLSPAFAQVSLPYSINSGIYPGDSTQIAQAPTYIDSTDLFIFSGFQNGDTVPDFTLYDTLGNATTLSATLNLGKPVLLVAVSLSCPSSRHSMTYVLPDIYAMYHSQVNILLVYVVEAHPIYPNFSPYANMVWTTSQNFQDSVLIRQESNYFQRRNECAEFVQRYSIAAPVLIDGVNNEYWLNFGPAPNSAYLIDRNGSVYTKYGWFDHSKLALISDISALLAQSGISETSIHSFAEIIPNPLDGNSFLDVQNEKSYSFKIVDMEGRTVVNVENISSPTSELGKYNLRAGVYSVVVNGSSGKTYSLRFVVN